MGCGVVVGVAVVEGEDPYPVKPPPGRTWGVAGEETRARSGHPPPSGGRLSPGPRPALRSRSVTIASASCTR